MSNYSVNGLKTSLRPVVHNQKIPERWATWQEDSGWPLMQLQFKKINKKHPLWFESTLKCLFMPMLMPNRGNLSPQHHIRFRCKWDMLSTMIIRILCEDSHTVNCNTITIHSKFIDRTTSREETIRNLNTIPKP